MKLAFRLRPAIPSRAECQPGTPNSGRRAGAGNVFISAVPRCLTPASTYAPNGSSLGKSPATELREIISVAFCQLTAVVLCHSDDGPVRTAADNRYPLHKPPRGRRGFDFHTYS